MNSFNATIFLLAFGYLGLFAGIFVETGLLIGLILPGGDTLLFTAGFLSSIGDLNIWAVISLSFLAAILADTVEYVVGKKYGPKVFQKKDSLFFDKVYVEKAQDFYKRYGNKTILIARFIPFVRTLAPAFAGVGKMKYSLFVTYNVLGAALWAVVVGGLGYGLGKVIPDATHYPWIVIAAMGILSLTVPVVTLTRNKKARARIVAFFKK